MPRQILRRPSSPTQPLLQLPAEPESDSSPEDTTSTLHPASSSSSSMHFPDRYQTPHQRDMRRYFAFASAIVSCLCAGSITAYSLYGHLFQERLRYTQLQVNIISITAELAMYLPVPIFGYLCDRVGPAPLSLFAGVVFGLGYTLAAFTYRSGAAEVVVPEEQGGWPFACMVVAFVGIGMGTASMYLSAVTTCAKNFGRGKHKGLALAAPIAAFGLSGMWQSQIGSRVLYERLPGGGKGDVEPFMYFLFLAVTLLAAGLLGSVGLKVVGEDELIDDALENLEASGLLQDSAFFRGGEAARDYGSINGHDSTDDTASTRRLAAAAKAREAAREALEARKKTFLLNEETRIFLTDPTMWLLALGFFLVTGPGEAFVNNLGTIIGTLYPPLEPGVKGETKTTAATHVSIVAVTSTIARILTGTLTDLLAPASRPHENMAASISSLRPPSFRPSRLTISRIVFLLFFSILMAGGQVALASGFIQGNGERFWIVSSAIGAGYGAVFSITPIIISVIWGVENFGTNWGIVAVVPALGATVWGVVYSSVYQWAAGKGGVEDRDTDVLCYGRGCYETTFWAMAGSVWLACLLWAWAWKGPGGWSQRGIAV
ncbi:putative transporter mch1 [Pseudogymnoascus verrucosus]|uniref:Probable transporter MCH1 n=1 Tax=Pseudogymnoascus verrucosus TaxID=342668 RepID=A0A1B8GEI5_9PEZI|nr:putative transporter mch1 [Pseudogymnoascus verrucosus]OBT94223.1 putative transporter mch1 [Pseudogymnoascus verrucosus]